MKYSKYIFAAVLLVLVLIVGVMSYRTGREYFKVKVELTPEELQKREHQKKVQEKKRQHNQNRKERVERKQERAYANEYHYQPPPGPALGGPSGNFRM
jgi:predicted Holliday junction resolvase-like endonuclease